MLFVGDFSVKNSSKCGADVFFRVPDCEEAVMCLADKICVLEKICSCMNYSAVGHEFNANEATIYIKYSVFKHKHKKRGYSLMGW